MDEPVEGRVRERAEDDAGNPVQGHAGSQADGHGEDARKSSSKSVSGIRKEVQIEEGELDVGGFHGKEPAEDAEELDEELAGDVELSSREPDVEDVSSPRYCRRCEELVEEPDRSPGRVLSIGPECAIEGWLKLGAMGAPGRVLRARSKAALKLGAAVRRGPSNECA